MIIDEMKEGDILIVHSVCRFSRNMLGGLQILDKLEKKKIKIYSVVDHVGYDSNNIYDRFRFRQIMNCAELETDKISQRIKRAKKFNNNAVFKVNRQKLKRNVIDNRYLLRSKKKQKKNIFITEPLEKYMENI
jgi:DNA invertase Pin-like site-specific DNA recombinase